MNDLITWIIIIVLHSSNTSPAVVVSAMATITSDNFVQCYMQRLHLDDFSLDEPSPTATKLATIHEAHVRYICFENIAQHSSDEAEPVLDLKVTREKILHRKRGGFCFEVNGLLAQLLEDLDYRVKRVPARVCIGQDEDTGSPLYRPDPSHIILLVTDCEDIEWFCDVGFGEPALHPLKYEINGEPQETVEGMRSKFIINQEGVVSLQWWKDDAWKMRLEWTEQHAIHGISYADFQPYLNVVLGPKSNFSQKLICCRVTRETKWTVAGNRFKVTNPRFGGEQTVTKLGSNDIVRKVLEESFGIPLDQTQGLDLGKSLQAPEKSWSSL